MDHFYMYIHTSACIYLLELYARELQDYKYMKKYEIRRHLSYPPLVKPSCPTGGCPLLAAHSNAPPALGASLKPQKAKAGRGQV